MLEHLNHPFLCNLRYSFQDVEYMCVSMFPASTGSCPAADGSQAILSSIS